MQGLLNIYYTTKLVQKSANQIAPLPVQYSLSIGPGTVPNDPARRFSRNFTSFFLKVFTPHEILFLISSNFVFLHFENVRRE